MILFIMFFDNKIKLLILFLDWKNNCGNLNVFHVFIDSLKTFLKLHKIPSGARFVIVAKKCINKQRSKHVTLAFKLCYIQIDAYHKKAYYFSGTKTFWVIKNNSISLECIKKINKRKNASRITKLDFPLYSQRYSMINRLIFYIKLSILSLKDVLGIT